MNDDLFLVGEFIAHSGDILAFKIECDALSDTSLRCLAHKLYRDFAFSEICAVPSDEKPPRNPAGPRLARILQQEFILRPNYPTLIVDDVLTTGRSMEEVRENIEGDSIGVVIFARGPWANWITPLFVENRNVRFNFQ